jgi:hypothetical protein
MSDRWVMPPAGSSAVLAIIRHNLGASRGPCDNLAKSFSSIKSTTKQVRRRLEAAGIARFFDP